MKCSRTQPCPNCPFLKKALNEDSIEHIKNLSKAILSEQDISCVDSQGESRCAGAIIHVSLSQKVFKNKKLRFYQERLGKSSEVFNKEEIVLLSPKK